MDASVRRSRAALGWAIAFGWPLAVYADAAHVSASLVAGGAPRVIAERVTKHVALGLPSQASKQKDNDFLLPRNGYVISYNASRSAMNWVSWQLTKRDLGELPRADRFRPDRTLPSRFYRPTSADYKIPGYSRGHMVRSGERTANARENSKTFVFSNMLPQAVNNNAGPWNMFEDFYRDEVKTGGKVAHIYAGGIFGESPVPKRGVAVPSATWKIVALTDAGKPTDELTESTRIIAIMVPNNNDSVKVEHDWGRYRTSVAEIEKLTGLTFFSEVSPALATKLKAQVDTGAVPPPIAHDWTPRNYADNGHTAVQNIVAQHVTGVVKWYDADKHYGFIATPDGKDVFVHAANRLTTIKAGETVTLDVGLDQQGRTFAMQVRSVDPKATIITGDGKQ